MVLLLFLKPRSDQFNIIYWTENHFDINITKFYKSHLCLLALRTLSNPLTRSSGKGDPPSPLMPRKAGSGDHQEEEGDTPEVSGGVCSHRTNTCYNIIMSCHTIYLMAHVRCNYNTTEIISNIFKMV